MIVDTESYELAKVALDNTLQRFPADEVLIFSDRPDEWAPYDVILIDRISSMTQYNRIILELLPEKLKTDFALVIQFDGFAINAASFTELFYQSDYIGAPWPAKWLPNRGVTVGNGGFSLRSKRLIESVTQYRQHINFDEAEDGTVCLFLRKVLEENHGVRFAPLEIARQFSVEMDRSEVEPFGFHGLHILPSVYGDNYRFLIENLPKRCFQAGSSKLKSLRAGFSGLGDQARSLLEAQVYS